MKEADCLSMQLTLFDKCECPRGGDNHDSLFGKTYQVHLQADQSVVLTLEPCLKASQKPVFQCLKMEDGQTPEWFNARSARLHGECLTLNIGESPSVAVESSLSQILQPKSDVPQKCYLSSRACQGILRRAARRGKKLPPLLETALKRQAGAENTINRHAVFSENEKTYSVQAIGHIVESEKSSTLAARDYKSSRNFVEYSKADRQKTDDAQTVRRLTVTECERLQGLPDGYTDVSVNGKPASERDRLMALGNGMAQPCADYVIQRIVDEVGKTYV